VQLEEVESSVDGLGESEAMSQGVDGSDASDRESTGTFGDLLVNVAGGQDRLGAVA
jgi:hypothetical protein